ncbi:MAG: zf-HC2 domain-containing protein [Pirellulales bacterium]
MNERPDDDLISAYLDGELSPAETAEVEKLLAESPEARQLLEDFRALGTGLRGLPKLHLDEGFRDRVLRQAERSTLAGNAWQDAVKPAPASGGEDGPGVFRFPRTWQGWKWATLATAAALAIWVFGRGSLEQPRQVAIAPVEKAPLPKAKVGAAPAVTRELDERGGAPVAEHFDVPPAPAEWAEERQETPELLERSAPPLAADAPAAPAAAVPEQPRRRSKVGPETEAVSPELRQLSVEGRKDAAPDADAALADSVELKLWSADDAGGAAAGAALGVEVAAAAEPEMLAIDLVVPQPEAASEALTQAFLKNRIVLEPEQAPGDAPAASLANSVQGGAGLNSSPANADFGDQSAQAAAPAVEGATQNAAVAPPVAEQNGLATTLAAPDPNVFAFQLAGDQQAQLYYVEATEAQVQQTIEDLKAQPQVFYSVLPVAAPPQAPEGAASVAGAMSETRNLADSAPPLEDKATPFAESGRATDSLAETVDSYSEAAKKEKQGLAELNSAPAPKAGADPAATRGVAGPETLSVDRSRAAEPVNNAEPMGAAAPANEAAVDLARDEKSQLGKSQGLRFASPEQVPQQRADVQQVQQTGRAYRLSPQTQRSLGRGPGGGPGYSGYGRARGGAGYGRSGGVAGGGMGGMGAPGTQLQAQTRQGGDTAPQAAQVASAPEGALAEEQPPGDPQRTVRAFFFLRQAPTLPAAEPAPAAAEPLPAAAAPPAPGDR